MAYKYHSWQPLIDTHAQLCICEGDRDVGKSFPMMIRAIKRGWRKGRSMLWLRRTQKEVKELANAFGSAKWQKAAEIAGVPFDCLKRNGRYIALTRKNGQKVNIIHYAALSESKALRDTDDPAMDTIFIDEAFTTVNKIRQYRGNEVEDAMDIIKSMRRDERYIVTIVAGNREMVATPWYDYFGIERPKFAEGITVLHSRSGARIAFERVRKHKRAVDAQGFAVLADGTGYGSFMDGNAKGVAEGLIEALRPGAKYYANVDFGTRLSIWIQNGHMVFSTARNPGGCVTDKLTGEPGAVLFTPLIRKRFTWLREYYRAGNIRFASDKAYEAGIQALKRLI